MTDAPSFTDLGLIPPLLRALRAAKYEHPTPIQAQAIPHLLEGRDIIGTAQTGTGKTAAFALPILQQLAADYRRPEPRSPRALVLAPTRELAAQIRDSFHTYGRHLQITGTVVYGGVGQGLQVRDLNRGVDVVIATPGRLLDLENQGYVRLDKVEFFVLDEVDRMLDMGFIRDIRRILQLVPSKRQTFMFSATMPAEIAGLARSILTNPISVSVSPIASTVPQVTESVYFVDQGAKRGLLTSLLVKPDMNRTLVFTRTKHGADRVVRYLQADGINADALHGNKSQGQRERALEDFRSGRTKVLVATDLAARGIDVIAISHVVNYDLPNESEGYVHRIGRTARAGATGMAISFCSPDERTFLRDIERLIGHRLTPANQPPVDYEMDHRPKVTVPSNSMWRSRARVR